MSNIPKNTVIYNGVNLYDIAFLRVISYNVFSAPLRERKQSVPYRHGAYNYGSKYYDERPMRWECLIERKISDSAFDELKYVLSREGEIVLWDQPDRYYIGQAYNVSEVLSYGRLNSATFELNFVCEPFACKEVAEMPVAGGVNPISYRGTAETSTLLVLKNETGTPINNIQVVLTRRKM